MRACVCACVCVCLSVSACDCVFQLDTLLTRVYDANLKLSLDFGIGLHHAGLHARDRKIVEELFVNQKIQVSLPVCQNRRLFSPGPSVFAWSKWLSRVVCVCVCVCVCVYARVCVVV